MSKTPRTEAFKWRMIDKFGSGTFDEAFPLLTELETELNEAYKEIEKLHKIICDEYPEDQAEELIELCKKKK
jgi:hypothetical protein